MPDNILSPVYNADRGFLFSFFRNETFFGNYVWHSIHTLIFDLKQSIVLIWSRGGNWSLDLAA